MLSNPFGTLEIIGYSGRRYRFTLYTYTSFDDLRNSFVKNYSALYLFSRMTTGYNVNNHNLIYLGETGDLSTRFCHHHKELEIVGFGANCIGICAASVDELIRKNAEKDLLSAYDFPCNDVDN